MSCFDIKFQRKSPKGGFFICSLKNEKILLKKNRHKQHRRGSNGSQRKVLWKASEAHSYPRCEGDFPKLAVKGLDLYSFRSLVFSDCYIVLPEFSYDEFLLVHDYERFGIENQHILEVPLNGKGIYDALLANKKLRKMIMDLIFNKGYKLQLFSSKPRAVKFIQELGLDWDKHTVNPLDEIAEFWGDKLLLRERASLYGLGYLFPKYTSVNSATELDSVVDRFIHSGSDGGMLKVSDEASSKGMAVFRNRKNLPTTFWEMFPKSLILEEAWDHYPFSGTWFLDDQGSHFEYFSLQILEGIDIGKPVTIEDMMPVPPAHRGNIVATPGQDIGPIKADMIDDMRQRVQPLLDIIWDSGYRGYLNMDFIFAITLNKWFVVEINARMSHSQYVAALHEQIQKQSSGKAFVLMANAEVSSYFEDYKTVRAFTSLYKGGVRTGIAFYHTPLLALGEKKCGLIAIAPSYEKLKDAFWAGEAQLKYHPEQEF